MGRGRQAPRNEDLRASRVLNNEPGSRKPGDLPSWPVLREAIPSDSFRPPQLNAVVRPRLVQYVRFIEVRAVCVY